MAAAKKRGPRKATLWAYDVGFGDCLLLELAYPNATRFVLFDFGSKGAAKNRKPKKRSGDGALLKIALDIEQRIKSAKKGTLAAIVATHRHQDHISGFMPGETGKGPGTVIARLKPAVVVQPWTDTPSAPGTWRGPGKGLANGADVLGITPGTLGLVHRFAELAEIQTESSSQRFAANTCAGILSVASNNVPNLPAVKLLEKVVPKAKHDYVYAGARAKNLERALPGVGVQVLAPPTLHQYADLFRSYADSSPEYWKLRANLSDEGAFWQQMTSLQALSVSATNGERETLFPRVRSPRRVPLAARWVMSRLDRDRGESLFELVRAADSVLNNTSVVLLLKIGKTRLLFPGDAQAEEWEYALSHSKNSATIKKELAETDLYKVGHHGSLNATPKNSLWGGFKKKGGAGKRGRLKTVLSTAPGYFGGKGGAETEVPRKTLVKELKASSTLYSTNAPRAAGELAVRVDVPLA